MKCIREILVWGGQSWSSQICSQKKIAFSKGGVALQFAPIKFWPGGGSTTSSQICSQKKLPLVKEV